MDILAALIPLEKALNVVIQSNANAKSQLAKMAGKILAIQIQGLDVQFYMVFSEDKIYFQQASLMPATTEISAYPFSLLKLMLSEQITPKQLEDIVLKGDTLFAQQCKQFFSSLKIDWQYYLAPLLGDVVVETADQFFQKTKNGLFGLLEQLNAGVVNYLQNESNHLPHPNAMDHYIQEVNEFRDGVERLEARLNLLKQRQSI